MRPFAAEPKYRRLIRFLWVYFLSNAKKQSARDVAKVTETVTKIIGEKNMSTLLDQFIAIGEARGEARGVAIGKAKDILRTLSRYHGVVPESLAKQVQAITDIEKLVQSYLNNLRHPAKAGI